MGGRSSRRSSRKSVRLKDEIQNFDEFFETLSNFYASSIPNSKKNKYLIHSNTKLKIWWDIYITAILLILVFVVPTRLAFVDTEPIGWVIVYALIDLSFLVDIILTFFTTYTDADGNEIGESKKIARQYLTGWFIFDTISIIPMDYIL